MGKGKKSGRKRAFLVVLSLLAVSAACVSYSLGYFDWWLGEFASGEGQFNPGMCGKAGITMEYVGYDANVMYISVSNVGRVPLNGNFLAVVSTDRMQMFVANSTEAVIRTGRSGRLTFAVGGLDGKINKISLVFQPCKDVTAERDGIDILG